MAVPSKKKRLVNEAISKIEALVEQVRKEAAETCATIANQIEELHKQEAVTLHNRFVVLIEEMKPAPENTLLVLELLKHEVIDHIISKMVEPQKAPPPPEPPEATPKE